MKIFPGLTTCLKSICKVGYSGCRVDTDSQWRVIVEFTERFAADDIKDEAENRAIYGILRMMLDKVNRLEREVERLRAVNTDQK